MKAPVIDRGLLKETMRRLRTPALTMLILATVFDLLAQLVSDFEFIANSLYAFHPSLYVIPFIVPFLLTTMGFKFQTKRCDSDFYHALPFTRVTLTATVLTAVAAWCGIIVVGSSVVLSLIPSILRKLTLAGALLPMTATLLASLFMVALTFLVTQLCGRGSSIVFTVPIFLFSPMIIHATLYGLIYPYNNLFVDLYDSRQHPSYYNLLFGGTDHLSAWLWTIALTVILLILGFFFAKRRPSETAGNAAVHPVAQACIRLLLAFVCCLPAISEIVMILTGQTLYPDEILPIILAVYVVALVVYFMYELITTRSAKALLRTVPWLGVLAGLNVICILLITFLAIPLVNSYEPTPETVDSISLAGNISYYNMEDEGNALYWESYQDPYWVYENEYDLPTDKPLFSRYNYYYGYSGRTYYNWETVYEESRCDDVRVTDPACIEAACKAFSTAKRDAGSNRAANKTILRKAYGTEWAVYEVAMEFHSGPFTRSRIVFLTETEYIALLNAINDIRPLPDFSFNFEAIQ